MWPTSDSEFFTTPTDLHAQKDMVDTTKDRSVYRRYNRCQRLCGVNSVPLLLQANKTFVKENKKSNPERRLKNIYIFKETLLSLKCFFV